MKVGNPNPSPSTRFTKENQPKNRGRKKGSPRKSVVNVKAEQKLSDMLGKAYDNVKKSLEKGDVKVSMWLIDQARKERADVLESGVLDPLVKALDTLEDVEQMSQQSVLLAIKGDMTFPQLKAVQDALARHSVLKGVIELSRLREEIEQLRQNETDPHDLGSDHIPDWGRLKDITPKEARTNGHAGD